MRILMLTDLYPPLVGGLEGHVARLSAELSKRGHGVAVATLAGARSAGVADENGIRIYRLPGLAQRMKPLFRDPARRFSAPMPDPWTVRALTEILKREKPDIVHAHNWMGRSFLPLKSSKGARFIVSLHSYELVCAKKTLMNSSRLCTGPQFAKCLACSSRHYGPLKAALTVLGQRAYAAAEMKSVDLYLPVSQSVARSSRLAASGAPYEVIPTFIEDEAGVSAPADRRMEQLPGDGFILYVGAFAWHKGIDVLIEAFQELRATVPLVMIGSTSAETGRRWPSNVQVHSDWPRNGVLAAWSRSVMGVVPSVWPEPCPTVVLEGMAAGRPVVASAVGGIPELITDGKTGILVKPNSVEQLVAAMSRVLKNPSLRNSLGSSARQAVDNFRASAVVPRIEAAYQRVLDGAGQPPLEVSLSTVGGGRGTG